MRRNQAFYGAGVETFPPLGEPFVQHLVSGMLSHRIPKDRMPSVHQLMQAFQILGSRPEDLRKAVHDALVRPEADLGDAIVAAAHELSLRVFWWSEANAEGSIWYAVGAPARRQYQTPLRCIELNKSCQVVSPQLFRAASRKDSTKAP